MLTVDRETWDRWNETGEWSLFRPAVSYVHNRIGPDFGKWKHDPPAEFVKWAQPCETCGDNQNPVILTDGQEYRPPMGLIIDADFAGLKNSPCPDCLDGKRRIAVGLVGQALDMGDDEWTTVECRTHCTRCSKATCCWCGERKGTVGHVVREWGPLVVMTAETFDGAPVALIAEAGVLYLRTGPAGDGTYEPITLPPDIDPATLVGQYAIGGKVVAP